MRGVFVLEGRALNTGIYAIVNLVNGKRYIGSAASFRTRFAVHRHSLRAGKHHSRHLQASWNKYGEQAFTFSKLLVCAKTDLVFYEQRAIDALRPEYNLCRVAGSALGVKWTPEARARHSIIQRANPTFKGRKHTPEALARMSESQRGKPSPTRGKKRPIEAVARTAAAHLGMKRSDETREKIRAKAVGRKRAPESVEAGAAKLRGRKLSPERIAHLIGNDWNKGRKHSDESKAKASAALKGQKRPKSPEWRAKIAASLKGRHPTPEARAAQSAAQLGKKRGPYRKKVAP